MSWDLSCCCNVNTLLVNTLVAFCCCYLLSSFKHSHRNRRYDITDFQIITKL
jgi:hypothetical protein